MQLHPLNGLLLHVLTFELVHFEVICDDYYKEEEETLTEHPSLERPEIFLNLNSCFYSV